MDTSNDGTTTSATDIVTHQMSLLRGGRGPSISGGFGVQLLGFDSQGNINRLIMVIDGYLSSLVFYASHNLREAHDGREAILTARPS